MLHCDEGPCKVVKIMILNRSLTSHVKWSRNSTRKCLEKVQIKKKKTEILDVLDEKYNREHNCFQLYHRVLVIVTLIYVLFCVKYLL